MNPILLLLFRACRAQGFEASVLERNAAAGEDQLKDEDWQAIHRLFQGLVKAGNPHATLLRNLTIPGHPYPADASTAAIRSFFAASVRKRSAQPILRDEPEVASHRALILVRKAWSQFYKGLYDLASRTAKESLALKKTPAAMMVLATLKRVRGDPKGALDAARQAFELGLDAAEYSHFVNPKFSVHLNLLLQNDDQPEIEAWLKQADSLPLDANNELLVAGGWIKLGKPELAVGVYEGMKRRYEKESHILAQVYIALYHFWKNMQDSDKALRELDSLLELPRAATERLSSLPALFSQHGQALIRKGRPAEAVRWLEESANRADHPHSWSRLGWAYKNAGRMDDALGAYDRAIQQIRKRGNQPSDRENLAQELTHLGVLLAQSGQGKKAYPLLWEAVEIYEALFLLDPRAITELAILERKYGEERVSINRLKGLVGQLAERHLVYPPAYAELVDHLAESRRSNEARRMFMKALKAVKGRQDLKADALPDWEQGSPMPEAIGLFLLKLRRAYRISLVVSPGNPEKIADSRVRPFLIALNDLQPEVYQQESGPSSGSVSEYEQGSGVTRAPVYFAQGSGIKKGQINYFVGFTIHAGLSGTKPNGQAQDPATHQALILMDGITALEATPQSHLKIRSASSRFSFRRGKVKYVRSRCSRQSSRRTTLSARSRVSRRANASLRSMRRGIARL